MLRPRRCRSNRVTPRSDSSSLIASVTADWLIDRLCAAPETVPSSATAMKYCSCRRVKAKSARRLQQAAEPCADVGGDLRRPPPGGGRAGDLQSAVAQPAEPAHDAGEPADLHQLRLAGVIEPLQRQDAKAMRHDQQ